MWRKGEVFPLWDEQHTLFQYKKQPHTAEEDKMWKEAGYTNESYTGKMYGFPNDIPDYVYDIATRLELTNCGYNFYRMDESDLMPPHTDHFESYIKFSGEDKKDILRAVIFLEDWSHGHYFTLGNETISKWKKGDYYIFDSDEWHSAGNFGETPRYTLQITGVDRSRHDTEYKQGIFWKNFDEHNNNLGFIGHQLEQNYRFLKEIKEPYFVFTGVGDIEFPFYPDDDFIIYLYEPLTFYVPGIKPNMGFYHEPTTEEYSKLRAKELDSIEKIQLNQNITVRCCDYKVAEHLGKQYPTLNLECEDIFVRSLSRHQHDCKAGNPERSKKFICPNWRYAQHRHLIMSFLANKQGNYSWYFNVENDLDGDTWVDYSKLDEHIRNQVVEGEKFLRHNSFSLDKTDSPINFERKENTAWPNGHYGITDEFIYNYRQCFIAVVNETRYSQLTGNFSEKLIDAIKSECSFILVAPPKTLEYVKSLGFSTFHQYWDESYDDEVDPMKRINKILNVIDNLNNNHDIEELYDSMKDIIDHNLQNLEKMKDVLL